MQAISSYRGNRPTNKHTYRQDRLQYTAPLSLAHSVTRRLHWRRASIRQPRRGESFGQYHLLGFEL